MIRAFDPLAALSVLHRHGVRFVLIGGIAGRLLGSPTVTNDLDICYARDPANLEALAAALTELEARLRGVGDDVPLLLDPETLRAGDHFTFATSAGNLDILGTPSGSEGYAQLSRNAPYVDVGGFEIPVSDLRDLMAMKRAAGRPKDRVELEILAALEEERTSEG